MKQFFNVEIQSTKDQDMYAAAELTFTYKDYRRSFTVWLEDEYFDNDENNFATNVFLSAVPTERQYGDPNFDNQVQISIDELFLNHGGISALIRESVDQEKDFHIEVPLTEMAFDLEYILFDEIIVALLNQQYDKDRYKQLVGYLADLITYNPELSIEGVDYVANILRNKIPELGVDLFERNNFEKVISALTTAEIQKRYA
ncbi:hypothetical protein A9986_14160 [Solibacillus silvestris]|nr:hypothetical protein [Solibacillus silvestris]OBW54762.1 hypothetical protein A9986_14160 [Solibacillus silvestris]